MTRRVLDHLVAIVYASACFAAVLAPALAVNRVTFGSDIGGIAGRDLVATSAVIGAAHAATAWTRLRSEERTAERRSHIWIASLNALVVLALSASLLVLAVLEHFADEHAALANRGLPVVALWAGLQIVAVALAETTGRLVFWWLEPHPAPHRCCRWGVLPSARQLLARQLVARQLVARPTARRRPVPRPAHTLDSPLPEPAAHAASAEPVRSVVAVQPQIGRERRWASGRLR